MSVTDSVSVFAEGTFEEQIKELVTYIANTRPESERETFKQPFEDALKTANGQKPLEEDEGRRRHVVAKVVEAVDSLGELPERETEGFFNMIFSHLFSLYDSKSSDGGRLVEHLVGVLSAGGPPEHTQLKFRILGNLFNATPRTSPSRLVVCKALIKLASGNDEMDALHLTPADVNRWINEWEVPAEEKTAFLKYVADAYTSVNRQEAAFPYLQSYVQSISATSPSAKAAGVELLVAALRLPNLVDTDSLLQIENIKALHGHPLYTLIQIFTRENLDEYRKWQATHENSLKEFALNAAQLERKMLILILASLGFRNIGRDIPYTEIASALKIEVKDVEKWVIDVIRTGLLSGKLSQTTKTFHVIRALPRSFGDEEWRVLERRLVAWRAGLESVRGVLTQAARQSQGIGQGTTSAGQAAAEALA